MKFIFRLLIDLCGVLLCGFLALLTASLAAQAGLLGSCFEGSCGYVAVFLVAPLLFIGFTSVFFMAWWKWRRRSS